MPPKRPWNLDGFGGSWSFASHARCCEPLSLGQLEGFRWRTSQGTPFGMAWLRMEFYDYYMEVSISMGVPLVIILIFMNFPSNKPTSYWGYHHDWNPQPIRSFMLSISPARPHDVGYWTQWLAIWTASNQHPRGPGNIWWFPWPWGYPHCWMVYRGTSH